MSAGNLSIDQALSDLDRRLARVEAHLEIRRIDRRNYIPGWQAHPAALVEVPAAAQPPPPTPAAAPAPAGAPAPAAPVSAGPPPLPLSAPQRAIPVVPAYAPRPAARQTAPQTELEQTIGLKWAGWVGAVVVVIGLGLGIKYAYDQNWFGVLPPAARLALMSLGAFALIGAGEVVYRRVHRFAAASLYGAGVATLFLVSYAGFAYYQLYEQQTAFLLMGLSTIVGAAVAMRGRIVSIAVLAQIGGNLAPVLLRSDHPQLVPFLAYLLTLQVVALVLAWWGGSAKWWTLRGLSLATTSLWMLPILDGSASALAGAEGTKLAFCLAYAGLYQLELLLSAARGSLPGLAPLADGTATPAVARSGMVFSMLVTALLTVALVVIHRDASAFARGTAVMSLAGACAAGAFVLSGRKGDALANLGTGYRIQAAALVVVAVPVALSGIWVVVGWAVLALAFAALGNTLDLPISRWAGVMVWRLSVLYLAWWAIYPGHHAEAGKTWLHLLGADVRAYTLVAWLLACAGHAVAWLLPQEGPASAADAIARSRRMAWVTNVSAGIVWVTASVAGLPPAGATLAILVYAWLLLGADLLDRRMGLVIQSAAVVALATVKWVAVDTLAERLSPDWSATARTPFFNAVMGVGVLISLTMALLYWLRRDVLWAALTRHSFEEAAGDPLALRGASPAAPAIALAAALIGLMTIGLSFEVDRVIESAAANVVVWPRSQMRQMAFTVLWTLSTCGFLALARRLEPDERRRPAAVHLAEGLALALAVKFLVVDTLLFRALHRPVLLAAPVVNFQTFTAAVVVAGLMLVAYVMARKTALFGVAGFLAVLVLLWGGTLEIDRWFERLSATGSALFSDPRRAKQVAFSIFWSFFAVSSVVAGFRFRTAGLRYFGLGLFAVTLVKIMVVDMSQVQTGYRILSFLGLGLLLLGTSVLYGKLSPILLRERQPVTS